VKGGKHLKELGLGKALEIKNLLRKNPDLVAVPSCIEYGEQLKAVYDVDPERVKYLACILAADIGDQVLMYDRADYETILAQERGASHADD